MELIKSIIIFLSLKAIGITGMSDDPDKMRYKDVYHSLQSVLNVFNRDEYRHLPEVAELMHIYQDAMRHAKENVTDRSAFIVIEGLDASGKSTLSKMLAKKMLGVRLSTPPDCLLGIREIFDQHNSTLRRAFYALGNYIAAEEVKDISTIKHVVLDRYWHSTAAYAIANEVTQAGNILPPPDSPVYNFPSDLLEPDFVFFLMVTEENRIKRIASRTDITPEEDKLKKEKVFRDTIEEAYGRMRNPSMKFIDSNMPPKKVLKSMLEIVEHFKPSQSLGQRPIVASCRCNSHYTLSNLSVSYTAIKSDEPLDSVVQVYKRMQVPPMFIEINANVNAEGVLIRIWDHVLTYGQLIL